MKPVLCAWIACLMATFSLSSGIARGDDPSSKKSNVFISFSGGGYHAHAAAFSMMVGMKDRLQKTNKDADFGTVTKNVVALSSNSGGSWFLTQAAYSPKFVEYMKSEDAVTQFTSMGPAHTGYLGTVYEYLTNTGDRCTHMSTKEMALCRLVDDIALNYNTNVSGMVGFLLSGGGQWDRTTEDAVFGKRFKFPRFDLATSLANVTLGGSRNEWAKDKDLVIASSILTQGPALAGKYLTLRSLMGSQSGLKYEPASNSLTGAKPPQVPGAAPIMLADIRNSKNKQPDFFPGGDLELHYGHYFLGSFIGSSKKASKQVLKSSVLTDKVKDLAVIHAAANSSAAGGGFIDVPMYLHTDIPAKYKNIFEDIGGLGARFLNGFAPAYTMHGSLSFVEDMKAINGLKVPEIAEKQFVRLADGGFIDNTAVAYMLRYMQDNNYLQEGFNLLAMNNFPGQRLVNPSLSDFENATTQYYPTTRDVALLFDNPSTTQDTTVTVGFGPFHFESVMPAVFERDAYFNKPKPDWQYPTPKSDCDYYIAYTKYDVTTRPNHLFGITKKVSGSLHVFSIISATAGVVPTSDIEMQCYKEMLDSVYKEVVNGKLGQYFEDALFPKKG